MKKIFAAIIILFLINNSLFPQILSSKRELRGVWVATIANIDWPSDKNSSSGEKVKDLINLFDKLEESGINTVFFQVRSECDAFYNSQIEPWSYWLTGKQGQAPDPYFDPLEFAVSEAHRRGMELHAWFNPYRVLKNEGDYVTADNHVSKAHPEWILKFSNYIMLNPVIPDVTNYILSVVTDVLKRYDVDGIHLDDYFYPYGPKITTEDSSAYSKYRGNFTNVDDWRRNSINTMIARINDTIKIIKPYVKFGVSPFGIVENKYAGTRGFESYNILYCDPLTWIKNRTVDYVAPQLYWEIGHSKADYAKLLPWWASITDGCHLYIGQFSSQMTAPGYKGKKSEIEDQLKLNRKTSNVQGEIFFSAKTIVYNYSGFSDSLKIYYKYPALVPVMEWKDKVLPNPPGNLSAKHDSAGVLLTWNKPVPAPDGETASRYVIYRFEMGEKIDLGSPKNILCITPDTLTSYEDYSLTAGKKYTYIVTSLDRISNESREYAMYEEK
jgi:uncharacterized lipoprotein YddW (UPF0748 family)